MKRGRLPLTALRSFEAAGRLGSFTLAADELCVSQAAISRQVRELETIIGRSLFDRKHRGVALTAAGAELLATVTRSFDAMETRLAALERHPPPADEVRISVEPSFAACWLTPRLPSFHERHPRIDLVVESDARIVTFRRDEPELAIRYSASAGSWSGAQSRHLHTVVEIAVAAPAFLARHPIQRPADLIDLPLLHFDTRDFWRRWFEAADVRLETSLRGHVQSEAGPLVQAVLAAQGVALMDEAFLREPLRDGRLVRLFPVAIPAGDYHFVARDFSRLSPSASAFASWLEGAVRDPA